MMHVKHYLKHPHSPERGQDVTLRHILGLKIFFLSQILILGACKNEVTDATPVITRDQLSIEKGKDVEIIYSDSAHIKVRVTGPNMLYYTDRGNPRQEFTEGVKTYFYDENQIEQGILTGKYAIRDEQKHKVIVRDSVVWTSARDGKLETSELIWDETANVIRSTRYCTITRGKEVIHGFNFETNDKLSKWIIKNPTGELPMESGKFQ
jgi:LPS export ABC transporter protein LptC